MSDTQTLWLIVAAIVVFAILCACVLAWLERNEENPTGDDGYGRSVGPVTYRRPDERDEGRP